MTGGVSAGLGPGDIGGGPFRLSRIRWPSRGGKARQRAIRCGRRTPRRREPKTACYARWSPIPLGPPYLRLSPPPRTSTLRALAAGGASWVRRLDAVFSDIRRSGRWVVLKGDTQRGEWDLVEGALGGLEQIGAGMLEPSSIPLKEGNLPVEAVIGDREFVLASLAPAFTEMGIRRWLQAGALRLSEDRRLWVPSCEPMDSQRASRNAVTSAVQTVASAGLMFALYRQIWQTVGAEGLGVWSVVLASTGAVRIGELGLTGSAVKYAAGRLARGERDEASRIIETTVLTVAVLVGAFAFGSYWVIDALLPVFVPSEGLETARSLLPFAIGSFWLAAVAGALQGGLDGCGRIDLRNAIVFGGQAMYVGIGWFWVASDGVLGLAYAQLVQGGLLTAACWLAVRRVLPEAPPVPWRWDRSLFREMLGYGVQFQVLALVRMLYEPTTKALMSKFGGLEAAGFYEMASLMWTKLRSLVVAAQQALTPEIAMMEETRPDQVDEVYAKAEGLNWYLCIPVFTGVAVASPLVSQAWIGGVEEAFVVFAVLLGVGWFANALSGPGFFVLLGTGQMGGVVASHITAGIINVVAGVALGWAAGAYGVAAAWAAALVAGAVHLLVRLERDRGVSARFPHRLAPLAWTAVGALGVGGTVFAFRPDSVFAAAAAAVLAGLALGSAMWRLPYRDQLLGVLRRALPRS